MAAVGRGQSTRRHLTRGDLQRFTTVRAEGLSLPGVEACDRYDGSPVLKVAGCFMAGPARHPSAEAETLVVRTDPEARDLLLEEAPETYYVTDYYRPYPVVLVRLAGLGRDVLRDILLMSRRQTLLKSPGRSRRPQR